MLKGGGTGEAEKEAGAQPSGSEPAAPIAPKAISQRAMRELSNIVKGTAERCMKGIDRAFTAVGLSFRQGTKRGRPEPDARGGSAGNGPE